MLRTSLSAELEYRLNFVLLVVMGIVWQSSVLVFATVLIARFPGLAGWSRADLLLLAAIRLLSHGLCFALFKNIRFQSALVAQGQIDAYLLRPLPVFRQVLLSSFPVSAAGDLAVAAGLFGLAIEASHAHWTLAKAAYVAGAVAGGTLLEGAILIAVASWSFRTTAVSAWLAWIDQLTSTFGNYPLRILPAAVNFLLTFVFPLGFLAYLPAAAVTGHPVGLGLPWAVAACAPLAGPLAFVFAKRLWEKNLRAYSGING